MMDLHVSSVVKSFDSVQVVNGVDLHVPAGSLTAILGPSGCGKTTLLRLIAGFDEPDSGEIRLGERVLCGDGRVLPPEQRHIGYVVQEGALFPHLTVAQNITFGIALSKQEMTARALELLTLVDLDGSFAARYPHQLSGGQQQRVALARALAPNPGVILLDEPFSSLDASLRETTRRSVVRTLRRSGATTILVTHDQAEALSLADQVAVMRAGSFVSVASPAELYNHPVNLATARATGEVITLPASVSNGIAESAVGRFPLADSSTSGDVLLVIRPEQISVCEADEAGTYAIVTDVVYYGHEATVSLEIAPQTTITARVPGFRMPTVGQQVSIRVLGQVHTFPSEAEPV
jgi:iron(III) transport system ATP-binding protein